MTHPWRKQDPNAAAAWLATFASFRKSNIVPVPARRTLTSMGLMPLEVELPLTLRVIPIDDVSDATDDL